MPVISIVFFCIFLLIYPPIGIKKVRDRSHAPKNANPDCCYTKPDNWDIGYPTYHLLEFAFLPNSKSGMPKKGIISPLKRPLSHKSIIWFCVANLLYHRICKTSSGWVKKIICIKWCVRGTAPKNPAPPAKQGGMGFAFEPKAVGELAHQRRGEESSPQASTPVPGDANRRPFYFPKYSSNRSFGVHSKISQSACRFSNLMPFVWLFTILLKFW